MHKYKVSVVAPIYNVEAYLAEFIESIVSQTLGFEENLQLILVNDGSSDDSGKICEDYENRYPDNIVYKNKKNGGVSSARNAGLEAAKGLYVAFIDADDKVSANYFEEVVKFHENHAEVPLTVSRIKWFGAKNEYHISDSMFVQTKIIDLNRNPQLTHSLISAVVFKAAALEGVSFDEEMTHNEDAKFIDTVLLRSKVYKFGVIREALYLYRKRNEQNSASDVAMERRSFYDSTIKYAQFLSSAGEYTHDGKIPLFIQYHALYHYRWRITQLKKPDILTDEEWQHYKRVVLDGIYGLDDETIIRGSINLNLGQKMALLSLKYEGDKAVVREIVNRDPVLRKILVDELHFAVSTINFKKSEGVIIEGSTALCNPELLNGTVKVTLDGKEVHSEVSEAAEFIFDDKVNDFSALRIVVATNDRGVLKIQFVSENEKPKNLVISYKQTARLSMRQYDYRIIKGKILLLPMHDALMVTDFKLRKVLKREAALFLQNLLKNKYRVERNVPKTLIIELVRLAALWNIRRKPSKVWLFSDRSISGGDNSEVLFRYVADQRNERIKPVFVIKEDTAAYKRLKRDGYEVVKFKSLRHLYLGIVSEMILPSHMEAMYLYPWPGVWHKYCGLIQYDIAHTQHGIVLNDMSNYIGKHKKNASLFLSVSEWEQNHLVNGDYGYTADQVPVTGLPRYDELEDTAKSMRIISLHATWRSWLAAEAKDGSRAYSKAFKESEYRNFYQNLINDQRLIDALERHDYTLRFYLHPNHMANKDDMSASSSRVEMMEFPYDYSKMFGESSLFITDYSNTLFDFAYLRKPIVHTQFDFDEFFSKHGSISKQLFDYETEGFGPVCNDYDSAIAAIISYIESGFVMEDEYKERVESFFTYDDRNNSKRAYETILQYCLENRLS